MKNREKYPNTDDAVKAYEAHKKEYNCDCTFEKWLDEDDDAMKNKARAFDDGVLGLAFAAPVLALLAARRRSGMTESNVEGNKCGDDDDIKNVECPFCHLKNGIIRGNLYPDFYCPNCDAVIARKSFLKMPFNVGVGTFKSWFDKLVVPSPKKD